MGSRKTEEIRSAINDIPQEILADALALFFAESKMPETEVAGRDKPEFTNFAQAVLYLKKYYDFPELGFFSTEADLVYIHAGDRKILLTEKLSATANTTPASAAAPGVFEEEPIPDTNSGRFSNLEI